MRSRELAIRMVVGAAPRTILGLVLRQSFGVACAGLLTGSAAALAASRWVQSEYHGVLGINPAAFMTAVGLFLLAMLFATAVPALRASRLNPVENLRDV